jgi:uncharacterized protein (TIGR02246 family)
VGGGGAALAPVDATGATWPKAPVDKASRTAATQENLSTATDLYSSTVTLFSPREMKYASKPLLNRNMPTKRHGLSSIQIPVLSLLLLIGSNIRPVQAAPSAESSETKGDRPTTEIRAVMQAQQEAWNRGDIDGFMNGYAHSDSTTFISDDQVTRGWQTVRNRYKLKYPSRAKMGKLRFSDLEIKPLSNDAALVLGRWTLKRVNDNQHGYFSLVWQRTADGWRIIHDHTSTATASP